MFPLSVSDYWLRSFIAKMSVKITMICNYNLQNKPSNIGVIQNQVVQTTVTEVKYGRLCRAIALL